MSRPAPEPARLVDAPVLVVDCQATGATPELGALIELAWCVFTPADPRPPAIRATLVALPEGQALPRRVASLTGIARAELERAPPAADAWRALAADAAALREPGAAGVVAVAHVAHYEARFVADLRARHGADGDPALDLLCTHALARRLLPDLPRRTLRAVSGYFGCVLDEHKRSAAHVAATCAAWRGLARVLDAQGLASLDAVRAWVAGSRAPGRRAPAYPLPAEARRALPRGPGVYRFFAAGDQLLYIGKATSLRQRVSSHYHVRPGPGRDRHLEMLSQVRRVAVVETGSPLEAALLESDAIKADTPPYNRALRGRRDGPWFASRDLLRAAPRPDAAHPLGPLPSPEDVTALGHLATFLDADDDAPDALAALRDALGFPGAGRLDPEVLRAGLAELRAAHPTATAARPALPGLLKLGARLFRDARLPDDDDEADAEDPARDWGWDPERVRSQLEHVVLRGAHMLRRARWLQRLVHATLLWAPHTAGEGAYRLLAVRDARVVLAEDATAGAEPAPPPGAGAPATERQARFVGDAATYDRLRVLTTELRRLAEDGRPVALRLGPGRPLDGRALLARLRWL
ncbi:MAG: hypothetical protein H6745_21670 [Deltaproteobacteria bacterium]|nr:hypothetical protein [Deltaproteobacteria bacterium]